MKPSYFTATAVGAVSGLVIALAIFTYVAATGAIPSLTAEIQGSQVVPTFEPAASATWQLVILSGLIGGMIIAVVTRAVGRVLDPDSKSSLAVVIPVGALLGAVGAMAIMPLGISVLGSVDAGLVIIGVADLVMLAGLAGLVSGAMVAWITYVLVRPPVHVEDEELLNV